MTFEASDLTASIAKSVEPDRSIAASQRVAGMTQDQIAAKAAMQANMRKVETADKLEKSRLKREDKERDKRNAQHHHQQQHQPPSDGKDHLIDTVA